MLPPDDVQRIIDDSFVTATELWIVGTELRRTLKKHAEGLEKRRGRKTTTIILPNPHNKILCQILADREKIHTEGETIRRSILGSIEWINQLKQQSDVQIHLRLIDHPISGGGIYVNMDSTNKKMFLWQYSFKSSTEKWPKFFLGHESEDGFSNFYEEVRNIFEVSELQF